MIVCCGTGGVGKTTTSAALAIEGARRGRRTVVVTIDPAQRLANALGLQTLSDAPHEIPRDAWDPTGAAPPDGQLFALMLDTERTFDQLVQKYALTAEQAESILENRFYRNIAGALSGTQEYMAMEKLFELHDSGAFDLIVVDTPPTRHALDFLDAPRRLTRLLDNRIFRMLMVPAGAAMRIGGMAATALLRTISRVVGTEVVDDVVAFFRAFEGMEQGFRDRANEVMELLGVARHRVRARHVTAARRGRGGRVLRRAPHRGRLRGRRAGREPGASSLHRGVARVAARPGRRRTAGARRAAREPGRLRGRGPPRTGRAHRARATRGAGTGHLRPRAGPRRPRPRGPPRGRGPPGGRRVTFPR